jgi:hypothetical protein
MNQIAIWILIRVVQNYSHYLFKRSPSLQLFKKQVNQN